MCFSFGLGIQQLEGLPLFKGQSLSAGLILADESAMALRELRTKFYISATAPWPAKQAVI